MRRALLTLATLLVLTGAGWYAIERARAPAQSQVQASARYGDARKPLYWYDPMRPEQHFEQPGPSPFMDMQLLPKYADDETGSTQVVVDPRMAQNLGMRTAAVMRGRAAEQVAATGSVAVDERRIVAIAARAPGWIARLAVRSTGETVAAGQLVAEIYAPELLAARQELALAEQLADQALMAAARTRLQLLGADASDASQPRSRLTAPRPGVVIELLAREGEQVAPGTPLMRIADLRRVWVVIEVPEAQGGSLQVGQAAVARFASAGAHERRGRVDFVYPMLDSGTRTVRARLSFDNADLRLKPGMYAEVTVSGIPTTDVLLVPSESIIRTGTRTVVIVAEAHGRYRPVTVRLGEERGTDTIVLAGLTADQRVVVSGQFLIDSEASLQGAYQRMQGMGREEQSPAAVMGNMGGDTSPGAYEAQVQPVPAP